MFTQEQLSQSQGGKRMENNTAVKEEVSLGYDTVELGYDIVDGVAAILITDADSTPMFEKNAFEAFKVESLGLTIEAIQTSFKYTHYTVFLDTAKDEKYDVISYKQEVTHVPYPIVKYLVDNNLLPSHVTDLVIGNYVEL